MTFEILLSCMSENTPQLVKDINLNSNAVIVSQCDKVGYKEFTHGNHTVKVLYSDQVGLTKSRNKAIEKASADICLLCDDDEYLYDNYQQLIIHAFEECPHADIIIFKICGLEKKFKNKKYKLRYIDLFRVASVQISFQRKRILSAGILFDESLGAGTGNGAEEELKFLMECRKKKIAIYYYPIEIASLRESTSTWFEVYGENFFVQRGKTTRYILGIFLAEIYGVYYLIAKYPMYKKDITFKNAFKALHRGIYDNRFKRTCFD